LRHFPLAAAQNIFRLFAPTLSSSEIAAHLDAARGRRVSWSAARLGEELCLTVEERSRLKIKTIRAKGVSKDEQAAAARERRNATKRQNRAAASAAKPRAAPLSETKPWETMGVSRRTYFRRRTRERDTDGGLIKDINPMTSLGDEAPIAAACSATGVQAEKLDRGRHPHLATGHRPEPNTTPNHSKASRPKGAVHTTDTIYSVAKEAASTPSRPLRRQKPRDAPQQALRRSLRSGRAATKAQRGGINRHPHVRNIGHGAKTRSMVLAPWARAMCQRGCVHSGPRSSSADQSQVYPATAASPASRPASQALLTGQCASIAPDRRECGGRGAVGNGASGAGRSFHAFLRRIPPERHRRDICHIRPG
jgi:hypothetical protein